MIDRRLLVHFDLSLVGVVLLLVLLGLVVQYSATLPVPEEGRTAPPGPSPLVYRQLAWLGVSLLGMMLAAAVDYRHLGRWAWPVFGLSLLSLVAVLLVGHTALGARRWLRLGPVTLGQPSELTKVALILVLARHLAERAHRSIRTRELAVPLALLAVPLGLIQAQPDLGTALSLVPIAGAMIFVAGLETRTLLRWAAAGVALAPVAARFVLKPYQLRRLLTVLNPEAHLTGAGWQAVQSKIAIGAGQLTGRGLFQGKQGQLGFLPEQHTDFIFSVLAEETGFVGSIFVLLALLFVLYKAAQLAREARDRMGLYLCVGVLAMIAFQVLYNVGMVCGLFPITGLPLPLLSYGGSSLLSTFLGVGLLLNVGMRKYMF